MLKQGGWQMMMLNSSCETASDQAAEQLRQINAIVKEYDEGAMVTGEAAMTEDLIETTAVDFVVTNLHPCDLPHCHDRVQVCFGPRGAGRSHRICHLP